MSPANEPTWVVADNRSELVICVTNASGVFVEVDWAEVSAPATSIHAAAAVKKAITSLIIKKPKFDLSANPDLLGLGQNQ